jgi:hypothetical protein
VDSDSATVSEGRGDDDDDGDGHHTATSDVLAEAASDAACSLANVQTAASNIVKLLGTLNANEAAAREQLDATFREIQRSVIARKAEASEALAAEARRKRELLRTQLSGLENAAEHVEAAVDLVNQTLATVAADSAQLEELAPVFTAGLDAAQELHAVPLAPTSGPKIEFNASVSGLQVSDFLGTVGAIESLESNPGACTATGQGLTLAAVGAEAEFVVTTRDYAGQPRVEGGATVTVTLVSTAAPPGRIGAVGTFDDVGDGTYRCRYTPEQKEGVRGGLWNLEVLVRGEHIAGSPFPVQLTAGLRFEFSGEPFDTQGLLYWIGTAGRTAGDIISLHIRQTALLALMEKVPLLNRCPDRVERGKGGGRLQVAGGCAGTGACLQTRFGTTHRSVANVPVNQWLNTDPLFEVLQRAHHRPSIATRMGLRAGWWSPIPACTRMMSCAS